MDLFCLPASIYTVGTDSRGRDAVSSYRQTESALRWERILNAVLDAGCVEMEKAMGVGIVQTIRIVGNAGGTVPTKRLVAWVKQTGVKILVHRAMRSDCATIVEAWGA